MTKEALSIFFGQNNDQDPKLTPERMEVRIGIEQILKAHDKENLFNPTFARLLIVEQIIVVFTNGSGGSYNHQRVGDALNCFEKATEKAACSSEALIGFAEGMVVNGGDSSFVPEMLGKVFSPKRLEESPDEVYEDLATMFDRAPALEKVYNEEESNLAIARPPLIDALGPIYERLKKRVENFIGQQVDSGVEEDLASTVFTKVLDNLATYKPRDGARFISWLYKIAHNAVIDHYRTSKEVASLENLPVKITDQGAVSPEAFSMAMEEGEILSQALEKLRQYNPLYFKTLKLRFGEDLSAAKVAEILGDDKSEERVRVTQHRALVKLREILDYLGGVK